MGFHKKTTTQKPSERQETRHHSWSSSVQKYFKELPDALHCACSKKNLFVKFIAYVNQALADRPNLLALNTIMLAVFLLLPVLIKSIRKQITGYANLLITVSLQNIALFSHISKKGRQTCHFITNNGCAGNMFLATNTVGFGCLFFSFVG